MVQINIMQKEKETAFYTINQAKVNIQRLI